MSRPRAQKTNQFNAIRLSFNHQAVLENDAVSLPAESLMSGWDQLPYLGMLVEFVQQAQAKGLLVVISCGRVSDSIPNGLWYDHSVTEELVLKSWESIASMLCAEWNVIGADLQNEVTLALSDPPKM